MIWGNRAGSDPSSTPNPPYNAPSSNPTFSWCSLASVCRNAAIVSPERPVSNARNPSSRKRSIIVGSSRTITVISLFTNVHHRLTNKTGKGNESYVILVDRVQSRTDLISGQLPKTGQGERVPG